MKRQSQDRTSALTRKKRNDEKTNKLAVLALAICLYAVACESSNRQESRFRPVYLDPKTAEFIVSKEELSFQFKKRLKQILIENNIQYNEQGEHIFIPRDKWNDTDLMWNLTNKVYDPNWCPSPLTTRVE